MDIQTILINLFASIALIAASTVVAAKNPITSIWFLIITFCNATGLLILLRTEFVAMMFLIIYVGAIAVLFLFVVMMLNIKVSEMGPADQNPLRYLPIGGAIGIIFLLEIFLVLEQDLMPMSRRYPVENNSRASWAWTDSYCVAQEQWATQIDTVTNIESLGLIVYTYHFCYFVAASLILLVAMIGAIVLTMHKRKHASKKQLIFKQVTRNFEDAIGYAKAQDLREVREE